MSENTETPAEIIAICLAVITTALVIGGFFYFTLVYNNSQNIKRDEFYATHCKSVANVPTVFNNQYQCVGK
jgi:flagellar basal body-associated protein FliL